MPILKPIEIDNLEIECIELSKREKDMLVQMCMQGLESKNPRVFYQATAAAKFVGRDKRLLNPLIKAFKKRRGWKRWLVLDVIKYFKYDDKI